MGGVAATASPSLDDGAHDDGSARLQCAEAPSLPKQPLFDVTQKEFAKTTVISGDGTAVTKDGEKFE